MLIMCKTAAANVTTVIAGTAAVRAHLQQLIATSQIAFHVTSTIAVTMTAVRADYRSLRPKPVRSRSSPCQPST
jgi:predicted RND superfamily exporter protein